MDLDFTDREKRKIASNARKTAAAFMDLADAIENSNTNEIIIHSLTATSFGQHTIADLDEVVKDYARKHKDG